ncbi:NtaA/DmoA family FMN-dependent monooxygenase [Nocardioides sp. CER19]|uniref:NtaA/DmoA family FMN-dependent monooxygenase n=1 Tax=Nocardioides sp. CER19 TaxID=3038538 RepID=UPI00244D4A55|nr:NtaA/DmoA family FMN-dependent monooxygenase [Nocardioides sp. CER19]MDH2416288.1 NtaA/DmoA family FMN-dependent monooxygenase [Nocardioides sp. CER19]
MTQPRHAHFTVFLTQSGYHESGWLVQDDDAVAATSSIDSLARSTAIAERGLLDAVFLADSPSIELFRAQYFPQVRFDPVTVLTALGQHSRHIGLFATASTTYNAPYELARRFATADHATGGRFGWNVVTTGNANAAANFGSDPHPQHDDRYARAVEFVEVVRRLWDGWEDDAVVGDRASGRWADIAKIHPAEFHGDFYDVTGALPVPRPPQGRPVLAQAGSSEAGIDLAGRTADVVFTPQADVDAARAFRARIDAAAASYGRPAGSVKILPGIAFVIGSTEAEAAERRRALEESADPELRWRMLAHNAGLDPALIDPDQPLSEEAAATAEASTFAQVIIGRARETNLPFREVAQLVTGLPGGLEFTGTPEQFADLIEEWVTRGGSDGFTLQPTTLPDSLELFVEHVVPILQTRGLHRTEYAGTTLRDHLGLAPVPASDLGSVVPA